MEKKNLISKIRIINDFPKPGIAFLDITTILKSKTLFRTSIDMMASALANTKIDKIVGIESRGFIFASALAYHLDTGLVIARKPGKLPASKVSKSYGLEYGKTTIEIHTDSIESGEKILIVDDVLATGGTAAAAIDLVNDLGGEITALLFFAEIVGLHGRAKLNGMPIISLLDF